MILKGFQTNMDNGYDSKNNVEEDVIFSGTEQPLVTVLSLTFNQALYVRDMLEGFLRQKTSFPVEYIIHDDASTDGTQRILKEYEAEYPGKFKMIYQKENQWSQGVKITQTILAPMIRGKYVAFCEGDDFWLDSHKLQEQVDFLEANPDYVCVAHNALRINMRTELIEPFNTCEKSREVEAHELIDRKFPYLATASKMHRKEAFVLDGFFLDSGSVGDVCADYYALTKGKTYYIDKIMSAYRFNVVGSYSDRVRHEEKNLWERIRFNRFLCKYNQYTEKKYAFYLGLYMSRTLSYLMHILDLKKISEKEFCKMVQKIRTEEDVIYEQSLVMIEKAINLYVYGRAEWFCEEMKELDGRKKLYIYGAGDYGVRMANVLLNAEVPFEGFVVSDISKNSRMFLGKPVIDVYEFAKNKENAKLIISLDIENWQDVHQNLEALNIGDYVCPFYIEPEDYED